MGVVERFDSLTPRLEMPLSLEAAACTLSMGGTGGLEHGSKGQQISQSAVLSEAIKQAETNHAVFDMVVNAGAALPGREVQQSFCLRSECSGAFAAALNSIDFSAGGTLSPKLLVSSLHGRHYSPLLACIPGCSVSAVPLSTLHRQWFNTSACVELITPAPQDAYQQTGCMHVCRHRDSFLCVSCCSPILVLFVP